MMVVGFWVEVTAVAEAVVQAVLVQIQVVVAAMVVLVCNQTSVELQYIMQVVVREAEEVQ